MNKMTMEQGIKELMAILEGNGSEKIEEVAGAGGAHVQPTKSTKSTKSAKSELAEVFGEPKVGKVNPVEVTYDGYGHKIAVGGKAVAVGPKKKRKNARTSDVLRDDLMEATFALLSKVSAFEGKVGRNTVDGIIVRMSDADYTIKIGGHAKREFEGREANFVPEKNFVTRGKTVNHSSAIAKILVAQFGNQFSSASFAGFEIEGLFTLLSASASTIRFEIQKPNMVGEFSFKITKKRSRVVFD